MTQKKNHINISVFSGLFHSIKRNFSVFFILKISAKTTVMQTTDNKITIKNIKHRLSLIYSYSIGTNKALTIRTNKKKQCQGFWTAIKDLDIKKAFVVAPVKMAYPAGENVFVCDFMECLERI
jgi:hypothetical protein